MIEDILLITSRMLFSECDVPVLRVSHLFGGFGIGRVKFVVGKSLQFGLGTFGLVKSP